MEYTEFNKYKKLPEKDYPLVSAYSDSEGNILVVEPAFYFGLQNIQLRNPEYISLILAKIDLILKQNHKVILTADFDSPFFEKDGFIYKELGDILDLLNIYYEDKSRGSDYGD